MTGPILVPFQLSDRRGGVAEVQSVHIPNQGIARQSHIWAVVPCFPCPHYPLRRLGTASEVNRRGTGRLPYGLKCLVSRRSGRAPGSQGDVATSAIAFGWRFMSIALRIPRRPATASCSSRHLVVPPRASRAQLLIHRCQRLGCQCLPWKRPLVAERSSGVTHLLPRGVGDAVAFLHEHLSCPFRDDH